MGTVAPFPAKALQVGFDRLELTRILDLYGRMVAAGLWRDYAIDLGRDLVGAARQSLAAPDWWLKMELGRGGEIRRCLYTNYCEGLDQKHVEVTCQLWDREFEGPDAGASAGASPRRTQDGKRRLEPPRWVRGD